MSNFYQLDISIAEIFFCEKRRNFTLFSEFLSYPGNYILLYSNGFLGNLFEICLSWHGTPL